jgi:hypothetical protein
MKMTNDELQDLKARCLTAIHRDYTIAHVESHIANLKVEAGNPALPADPRMALVALIDTALAIRAGKIAPPAKPIVAPEVKPAPKPEPVPEPKVEVPPEPAPVVEEPKAEEPVAEPVVEEPVAEPAKAEEPVNEEPKAEAPAAEETAAKGKRGGRRA